MQELTTITKKNGELRITDKELSILYEIGLNTIPAATYLVDYISDKYNISASGVWYTLKKLKKEKIVDFTEKGEEQRPLTLTQYGMQILRKRPMKAQNRQYSYIRIAASGMQF